jgi:hypothetical protein
MTDRQADLIKAIHGILGEEGLSDEEVVKRIRALLYGEPPPEPALKAAQAGSTAPQAG